uniref:Glycosyltransferase family 92 protein n=1 Tax=Davidia involucrata TaxID=16924 RepID=A0A5B7C131_DAVIN
MTGKTSFLYRFWVVLQIVGSSAMKDRRKRGGVVVPWNRIVACILFLVFFWGFSFSTIRLFFRETTFRPRLVSSWRTPPMKVISGESPGIPSISIRETVVFPDQALIFLTYPPSTPLFTKDDIDCVYFGPNSSEPELKLSPVSIDGEYLDHQIVRCPLQPRGLAASVALKSNGHLPSGPTHHWDTLAYEAMIDRDNTTIVFVKGLNLRSGRVSNPSRFECVYGWDFRKPKFLLRSDVISIAQEIVRCKTPLSILNGPQKFQNSSIKVSVRVIGRGILHSIARPDRRLRPDPPGRKQHEMCICTMVRNQARFLREWVMYHARIGVERWFIYDNNSYDDIDNIIESLDIANFNITRHVWPWIKTQEAGFAHCALRARDSCEWVGFIDVDEFLHLPSGLSMHDILWNQSRPSKVAELRTSCYSFGPSGLKWVPAKGVTVGYTCRVSAPERHKSIVRPEALNSTLINLVHHFHLRDGFKYENMDRNMMVINHYKYQVWDVFKEKFYRRVATYVADWQEEENVGSKDRTPGLGTRAVEPPDWPTRFCEVTDTGLRDRVLEMFGGDRQTQVLPWQEHQDEQEDRFLGEQRKKIL